MNKRNTSLSKYISPFILWCMRDGWRDIFRERTSAISSSVSQGVSTLAPLCELVRDASDRQHVSGSTPFLCTLSKSDCVVLITWSPSDYTPVVPDFPDRAVVFTNHRVTACQSTRGHLESTENPRHMLYNIMGQYSSLSSSPLHGLTFTNRMLYFITKCYSHYSFIYIHSLWQYNIQMPVIVGNLTEISKLIFNAIRGYGNCDTMLGIRFVGVWVGASQRIPLSVLAWKPLKGPAHEISHETGRTREGRSQRRRTQQKGAEEDSRHERSAKRRTQSAEESSRDQSTEQAVWEMRVGKQST